MAKKSSGQRVLLIEESATLRYILVKVLQKQGYELMALETFNAAYETLDNKKDEFQAVVVGWPNYSVHKEADRMLELLESKGYLDLPVLMVAHDAEIDVLNWMSHRRCTALIPWESYQESVATLQKLLGPAVAIERKHSVSTHANPIRILFVDDSASIRHYYQRLLNRNGYITEIADSVDTGFKLAIEQHFDVVITDYFMPDKNGHELCQMLRDDKRTSKIRAAVITGTYLDEIIKDCLHAGAVECMFKNEAEELFLSRIAAISRFVKVQHHIESERGRLAGILESVGEGVYGVDNKGLVTFVNPAALNIVGAVDEKTVIGKKATDVFHHRVSNDYTDNDKLYRAYGKGIELRCWETKFKHSMGKPVPVECTVYPLNIDGKQEGSVVAFRDISERKMLEEKLHWQATHDHLTKLPNRRYFEDQLDNEVSHVHAGKCMSALLYLDLDRFKYINDTAGHDAGDKLLIEIAKLMTENLREKDILARLGGDEFSIILSCVDEVSAMEVAEKYRTVLDKCNFSYEGKRYNIHASFGVALIDVPGMTPGDLLANADIACHIAKRGGRNKAHLYNQSGDEKNAMGSELGWSQRVRDAMTENRFVLHYQPILDLKMVDLNELPAEDGVVWDRYANDENNLLHFEILIRMRGDDGELFLPDSFIPTAERFNLMCDVDLWVVNKALETISSAHKERKNIAFSINLSGQTLNSDSSLHKIKNILSNYDVNPQSIVFEVTETCAIANLVSANHFIDEMKILGYRFSLDDFGSGFCSFSQLKCLPADYVKIDGAFVQGMARGSIDRAIVTAMNDVAHSLGRYTVAEYVESPEIMRLLKVCGVDYVQGNYVSEPKSALGFGGA